MQIQISWMGSLSERRGHSNRINYTLCRRVPAGRSRAIPGKVVHEVLWGGAFRARSKARVTERVLNIAQRGR